MTITYAKQYTRTPTRSLKWEFDAYSEFYPNHPLSLDEFEMLYIHRLGLCPPIAVAPCSILDI